jgi:hypothetical protein
MIAVDALAALQRRIDDIMLGRVRYEHMRLQLYEEDTGQLRRTMGNEVATLSYRRIDDLEQDPLFLAYIQSALFRHIARRYIGAEVAIFRSMFMNKPAEWHQTLPWHQDVGIGWGIDQNYDRLDRARRRDARQWLHADRTRQPSARHYQRTTLSPRG